MHYLSFYISYLLTTSIASNSLFAPLAQPGHLVLEVSSLSSLDLHRRGYGFTSSLFTTRAPSGGEWNSSASALTSRYVRVLFLAGEALEQISMLLLQVSLPDSDRPQICPSKKINLSSSVDSCQRLGATRLGFLIVRMQQQDLVPGSSDGFKGSMTRTVAPDH